MELAPDILSLISEILTSETEDFNILQVTNNSLINYQFDVIDGRIRAYYPIETPLPTLDRLLPSVLVEDDHTKRWWDSVFFIDDDKYTYDYFYDDLSVTDLADFKELCFGDFIRGLIEVFKENLDNATYKGKVYLTGVKVCPPLYYVLQSLLPLSKLMATPVVGYIECLDKGKIYRPTTELEKLRISIDRPCTANNLVDEELQVLLPLNFMDLSSLVTKTCSWGELIAEPKYDYLAGKIGFKLLYLSVDYDIYSNIYLSSRDLDNNVITKKL